MLWQRCRGGQPATQVLHTHTHTHTHTSTSSSSHITPTTRLSVDALLASDPLCTGQEEIGMQCSAHHHTVQSSALQSELASWPSCRGPWEYWNALATVSWWPASDTSA